MEKNNKRTNYSLESKNTIQIVGNEFHRASKENVILDSKKQNLKNKKIYFDSDGTEVKIGYDEETGIGFVEIISD